MSIKDLNPATPADNSLAGLGDDEIRALKAALQACFPELEGLISNTGGTGDPGDTDPPDAATFSNLFTRVTALETGLGGAATVPLGMIAMWGGAVSQIPAGWALCDGTGDTPDLRDRFIVGADVNMGDGSFNVGNNGGNNWKSGGDSGWMDTQQGGSGSASGVLNLDDHVIAGGDLPEHEHHMFRTGSGTNITHPGTGFAGYVSQSHPSADDRRYVLSEALSGEADQGKSGKIVGGGNASGDLTLTHNVTSVDVTLGTHNHDYSPRYYALAFIQYVGA